jgi:hypothetical protein
MKSARDRRGIAEDRTFARWWMAARIRWAASNYIAAVESIIEAMT